MSNPNVQFVGRKFKVSLDAVWLLFIVNQGRHFWTLGICAAKWLEYGHNPRSCQNYELF